MDEILKALLVIALLVILLMIPNIKIVSKHKSFVVERFGRFLKIIDKPGIHVLIPLLDRVVQIVEMEQIEKIFSIDDTSKEEKIKVKYTYQITDVKQFVYAEIDSIKHLEHYIKEIYLSGAFVNQNKTHIITEYAEGLGIQMIDINYE